MADPRWGGRRQLISSASGAGARRAGGPAYTGRRRLLAAVGIAHTHRRNPAMAHTLPQLPYAYNALEPYIDAQTMEIHSQRHHKAYVDNLNKALESAPAD